MTTFAPIEHTMSLRTKKIDDALLDLVKPFFSSDEDLQQWLEEQMASALLDYSSKQKKEMPCSYTDDEVYEIVKSRLKDLEDETATLIDGEEVFSQIQTHYGFKA